MLITLWMKAISCPLLAETGFIIPNNPSSIKLALAGLGTLALFHLIAGGRMQANRQRMQNNSANESAPMVVELPQEQADRRVA